jgi:hypothetical protein
MKRHQDREECCKQLLELLLACAQRKPKKKEVCLDSVH